MRPVMVGISILSGSWMPPLVIFLSASLRMRTRLPSGSTVSSLMVRDFDSFIYGSLAEQVGHGIDEIVDVATDHPHGQDHEHDAEHDQTGAHGGGQLGDLGEAIV